jgi:transcriptional regulator with XRE-family HTH domain
MERLKRDWNQSDLAEAAVIGLGAVNALESGRGNPTLKTLQAVAAAFGMTVAELVAEDLRSIPNSLEHKMEAERNAAQRG